jgi:hypothetical protein
MEVKEDKITMAFLKASMFFVLGDSRNALFWSDAWLQGQGIADIASDLITVIPMHRRVRRTVCAALHHDAWILDITGACTVQVIMQYLDVWHRDSDVVLNPDAPNHLIWRWSTSGQYSTASAYNTMFYGQSLVKGAKEWWKMRASKK